MKKALMFALFASLVLASPAAKAEMNKNDVKACLASGGVWNETKAAPHCVCPANYFSLLDPGKYKPWVMKYLDLCESTDKTKWSANMKKDKKVAVEAPKAPAPIRFSAALEPEYSPKAKAGAVVEKTLSASSGDQIIQIRTNCDNCLANGKQYSSDDSVRASRKPFSRVIALTAADPNVGGTAKLTVIVVTKDGMNHIYDSTAEWEPKVAPPPPPPAISPEELVCKASRGEWIAATRKCVCLNDLIEVNGKCEPKPVPPPVVVENNGTIVHPIVGGMCGYSHASSFKSGGCYASLGLALDIKDYLWWQGNLWLGGPGATRVYSDGTPVILANGNVDKRSLSLAYGMGFLAHLDWFGANLGVIREGHGLTGGITSPTDVSTSGVIGVKAILPFDGGTLVIGPNFTVGTNQMGSKAADVMWGLNLQAEVLFFNPHRIARIAK